MPALELAGLPTSGRREVMQASQVDASSAPGQWVRTRATRMTESWTVSPWNTHRRNAMRASKNQDRQQAEELRRIKQKAEEYLKANPPKGKAVFEVMEVTDTAKVMPE